MEHSAFACKNCGKNIAAEVPAYEVINRLTVSMVVMAHSSILKCPHCSQAYQFYITGIKDIQIGWKMLEEDVDQKVITPPKRGTSR